MWKNTEELHAVGSHLISPLWVRILALCAHHVPMSMQQLSEKLIQTHCELSSLLILFSSRMWRLRTLSRRSSSAWISASSYKWFKHANTQMHRENFRTLDYKERSSSKPTCTQPTSSVLNINGWLSTESVRGCLWCLFIGKTMNTSTNYRLAPSLGRFTQKGTVVQLRKQENQTEYVQLSLCWGQIFATCNKIQTPTRV